MGESKEGGFYDELNVLNDESKVMIQEYVESWLIEFERYNQGARSLFLNGRYGRELAERILENLRTVGKNNYNLKLFTDAFVEKPKYEFVDILSVEERRNAVQDALLTYSSMFQQLQDVFKREAAQIEERPSAAGAASAKRRRDGSQISAQRRVSRQHQFEKYEAYLNRCQPRFKEAVLKYADTQGWMVEDMIRFFELLFEITFEYDLMQPEDYETFDNKYNIYPPIMNKIGPLLEANNMDAFEFDRLLRMKQIWGPERITQKESEEIDKLAEILFAMAQYLPVLVQNQPKRRRVALQIGLSTHLGQPRLF